ncbi:MAG: M20/M25/M40 family metallo-hydrolase [Bacteroidota bacterium]
MKRIHLQIILSALAGAVALTLPCTLFAQIAGASSTRDLVEAVSLENLTETVQKLEAAGGYGSRVTLTPGNDSARIEIFDALSALVFLSSVEYDTFYIHLNDPPGDSARQFNIVGTLLGKQDPSRVLLLGAHFDCSASRIGSSTWNQQWATIPAPGADDNATGIATLIEIARILSDPASGFTNAYTLKFVAFGSEESGPAHSGGHGGSRHYAQEASSRGENIVGMISIDMIGYNPAHDYVAIVSDSPSQWLGVNFVAARDEQGIDLLTNSSPFPRATYSDHASFWEQEYPAILLIENAPPWNNSTYYTANPFYHTSADTFGTLNMELVKRVTQTTLATAIRLTGTVTDVGGEDTDSTLPESIVLEQNYPNPFNPTTRIRFWLSRRQQVRLSVFDLLGREVLTLLEGEVHPGEHTVTFSATGRHGHLPSGIYFYRLTTPSRSLVRPMVLNR